MSSENRGRQLVQLGELALAFRQHRRASAVRKSRRCAVAILMTTCIALSSCGCSSLKVDQPSPFSKLSTTAKSIFKRPSPPATQNTAQTAIEPGLPAQLGRPVSDPIQKTVADPSQLSQLSPQATNQSNRNSVSHVTFRDEQLAYEQGVHDAIQATYQQPLDVTYSNQQPMNYAPPNQLPANQQAQPQMMPQPLPAEQHNSRAHAPQALYDPAPQNYGGQTSNSQNNQTGLNEPGANSIAPTVNTPPSQMPQQQIVQKYPVGNQQPSMGGPSMGNGYLANGMNLNGSGLRMDRRFATQIAYDFQDENEELRRQLSASIAKIQQLTERIEAQHLTIGSTNKQLTTSNRLAVLLREKIANQNLKLQDLEKEKLEIEQNADKALQEIETTLDSMLIDTISKTK